jgi:hypothetical protein
MAAMTAAPVIVTKQRLSIASFPSQGRWLVRVGWTRELVTITIPRRVRPSIRVHDHAIAPSFSLPRVISEASRDILRFPSAVQHDPAIDAWVAAQRDDLRPLVATWFECMRQRGSDVRELMHDGCPTACVGDAAFGYVNAFRDHVNVGFFFGALLNDPAQLLEGTGKRGRHVKLRPGRAVDAAALARLVDTAYADISARLGT